MHCYSILLLRLALIGYSWSSPGVTAQTTAGFVSIDCGSNEARSYSDSQGIEWTLDANMMEPEVQRIRKTAQVGGSDGWPMYSTMRYFPDTTNHTKYCYSLPVNQGTTYLLRATFWMGEKPQYAVRNNDSISFKLLAGADFWDDVSISFPQMVPLFWEMYVPALSNRLDACVAPDRATLDPPFISSLELRRPLRDTMKPVEYVRSTNKALVLFLRVNYGAAATDGNVRSLKSPCSRNLPRISVFSDLPRPSVQHVKHFTISKQILHRLVLLSMTCVTVAFQA